MSTSGQRVEPLLDASEKLLEDIVQLRGADGKLLFINLSDVSGVRTYDETEAR